MILNTEMVVQIHSQLIVETGGKDGIRDYALLESALASAFQNFGGVDMFPAVEEKAARLCCGLVLNHAFIDGNKRIGTHVMLLYLRMNDIRLIYEQRELVEIILQLASGKADYEKMHNWILEHERKN